MSDASAIEALLAEWAVARDAGLPVSAAELCRGRPDLLAALQARIDAYIESQPTGRLPRADPTVPDNGEAHAALPFLSPPQDTGSIGRLGEYRVLGTLGRGGMGLVLRGEDPVLGRPVAIKVMRPDVAAIPDARARFLREARAAASLDSPHVVPIYQVGQHGDLPFLVMPLLKGGTLATRLRDGPLRPAETARIGRQVAEGLAAAHARGLVHRDIKPSNIWLKSPDDTAVILDFGIAASVADRVRLTRAGLAMGTPAYMSPEQADGLRPDARSDLFSLGCVLFEMCTGRRAFPGKTTLAIMKQLATSTPPPVEDLSPQVPGALSDLIAEMLSRDPDARPDSMSDVAAQLRTLEHQSARHPRRDDETETLPPRQRRKTDSGRLLPWIVAGLGLLLFATVGVVAWSVWPRAAPPVANGSPPEEKPPDKKPPDTKPPPGEFPVGWEKHVSAEGKYAAWFPGKPKLVTQKTEAGLLFRAEATDNDIGVHLATAHADVVAPGTAEARLQRALQGLLTSTGQTLRKKGSVTLADHPGLEVYTDSPFKDATIYLRARLILVGHRLHQVLALSSNRAALDHPAVERFFETFELAP